MPLLRTRVGLGVIGIKGYSAFPKASVLLEPHHKIVLCHIQDTHWRSLTPLQRVSRCILQPQPTGHDLPGYDLKLSDGEALVGLTWQVGDGSNVLKYFGLCGVYITWPKQQWDHLMVVCTLTHCELFHSLGDMRGCPRGVMVKEMDCGIVVSEFVLQSRYCVHFRANTLGTGMNSLILPAMG